MKNLGEMGQQLGVGQLGGLPDNASLMGAALRRAAAEVNEAPKTNGHDTAADVGADNIDRAGELMGQALRDIFEEGAKRAEAAGAAAVARGEDINRRMQALAAKCRQAGEAAAVEIDSDAVLAKTLATDTSGLIALIERRKQ